MQEVAIRVRRKRRKQEMDQELRWKDETRKHNGRRRLNRDKS